MAPTTTNNLQQRHTTSKSTSARSSTDRFLRGSTTVRRRKRRSDPNRQACFAATAFVAFFLPLGYLTKSLMGRGGSDTNAKDQPVVNDTLSVRILTATKEERFHSLYRPKFNSTELGYDIYDCPPTPPHDYPKAWAIPQVLSNWSPTNVTTISPNHREVFHSLCVFDYDTQYDVALTYRNAEKPFIIRNDPKVMSVVQKWDDGSGDYLHRVLGDVRQFRTERSPVNTFLWYRLRGRGQGGLNYQTPLNDEIAMTFGEWLEHALEKDGLALSDEDLIAKAQVLKKHRLSVSKTSVSEEDDDFVQNDKQREDSEATKEKKWYYFRLTASLKGAKEGTPEAFVYKELSFFDPRKRKDSAFYIVDPEEERGINCRFGMRGVIAVNHFDLSRNMIAVLGGERRYIIAHPSQCKNMALYPRSHPSLRHSSVDWTNVTDWDSFPQFKDAQVNEVVIHSGDVLYLPTSWFHFIINLSLNYQCSARSGTTYENAHYTKNCGFDL